MFLVVKNIFIWLSMVLRGNATVTSVITGSTYSYNHTERDTVTGKVKGIIKLNSIQKSHTITYDRWYFYSLKKFTYEVQITVEETGKEIQKLPSQFFPQLCSELLNFTDYPHICAINASLDCVIKMHFFDEV